MPSYTPKSIRESVALKTLYHSILSSKVTAEELETMLKDFRQLDRTNWTSHTSPLHAASTQSASHIKKCLDKGINMNSLDNYQNAISFSIRWNNVDATKYLLEKGATLAGYNIISAIAKKNKVILEACLISFGRLHTINIEDLRRLHADDPTMLRQFLTKFPEVINFKDFDFILAGHGMLPQAEVLIQEGFFKDPTKQNKINSLAVAIQAAEESKCGNIMFWYLYGLSVKMKECQDDLLARPLTFGNDSASTKEEAYIIMVNNDIVVSHF
jgi:hypothetical protein